MTAPIVLTRAPDAPQMRFSRSATGHVHSCWFSFETQACLPLCDYESRYHGIMAQAVRAFASALGIREDEVIVTHKRDCAEMYEDQFRLGTQHPVQLPQKTTKLRDSDAIDI